MVADTAPKDLGSLGWNELVAMKRQLSGQLKEITDQIVKMDKTSIHSITNNIKEQRSVLMSHTDRLKKTRTEIDKLNADLLSISEKISQSKNFLSLMEARLPTEKPEELHALVKSNQDLIDSGKYKSGRDRDEILSRIKEATMKLEAIKAINTIKEKYTELTQQSANISNSIERLEEERDSIRAKMGEINGTIDKMFESRRKLSVERQSLIQTYDGVAKQFDAINARLDAMSQMRRKQREEYGYNLPNDALFKVKEQAKKKLESGSKLSFEELKLLYGEKDQS